MKRFIYLFLLFSSCSYSQEKEEKVEYFFEIALKEEYGEGGVIRKWEKEINVFAFPETPDNLLEELDKIIEELNQIIPDNSLKIRRVQKKQKANLWLYCGDKTTYINEIEPLAKPYLSDNLALFYVYFNKDNIIYKGSIFIDVKNTTTEYIQRHLLREEFTQALGLFNDSENYPESIFYKAWSFTNEYHLLDQFLIESLYRKEIKAGMNRKQVEKVLKF